MVTGPLTQAPRSSDGAGLPGPETVPIDAHRLRMVGASIAAGLALLAGWVGHAQLSRTDAYLEQERRQQVRRVALPPTRGLILDRNGRVLAEDRPDAGPARHGVYRAYPYGSLAAHVLGHVGLARVVVPGGAEDRALRIDLPSGRAGIEKAFDAVLAGRPGYLRSRFDAEGRPVGEPLETVAPERGRDVVLSLDLDLQQAAEQALGASRAPRGAVVCLSVQTGEVLALASKPTYDLNALTRGLAEEARARVEAEGAWLNRATQGLYPPGSSFKIYTLAAAMRAGALNPRARIDCAGWRMIGGRRFACHRPEGHGLVPLRDSLAQSCNVFAYAAGLGAGPSALEAEARRFHFDTPTGLNLPGETRQMLVPGPAWLNARQGAAWGEIDTANLAIGQGFLRVTPLQAAAALASLARGETRTVPTLLHEPSRAPSGALPPEPLGLDAPAVAALRDAMEAVVAVGIGREAQVPGVRMAGKTGTAQITRPEGSVNIAWFVAFAPVEKPEIALAVALEAPEVGVEFAGAEHAAPVVSELAAAYFDHR